MFDNIGNKLMGLAKFLGTIGLVACFFGTLFAIAMFQSSGAVGLVIAIWGLLTWFFSWPIYALGQIANDVHALAKKQNKE